jgi:glycerol-3-phosphate acyltransferase PlsY
MTVTVEEVLRAALALVIGYLLGSVLPAEVLARRRGVDIRTVGDGNPGTVNAFRGLGSGAGTMTLVYDALVGVVAIQIAHAIGTSTGVAYLAGIMTVVGHRFPALRRFRPGGQGMAASAGLLLYGVAVAVSNGWLSAVDLVVIAAIAGVALLLTRSATTVGLVILPVLVFELLLSYADWEFVAFLTAVAAHIWINEVLVTRRWITLARALPFGLAERSRGGTPGGSRRG